MFKSPGSRRQINPILRNATTAAPRGRIRGDFDLGQALDSDILVGGDGSLLDGRAVLTAMSDAGYRSIPSNALTIRDDIKDRISAEIFSVTINLARFKPADVASAAAGLRSLGDETSISNDLIAVSVGISSRRLQGILDRTSLRAASRNLEDLAGRIEQLTVDLNWLAAKGPRSLAIRLLNRDKLLDLAEAARRAANLVEVGLTPVGGPAVRRLLPSDGGSVPTALG